MYTPCIYICRYIVFANNQVACSIDASDGNDDGGGGGGDNTGASTGAIVGGVVGGLAGAILLILPIILILLWFFYIKKRGEKSSIASMERVCTVLCAYI